ncbi:septum formation initiator family protein [Microbacterium limosum]|uniref:Septum formation initiator family protein n=1 Tax=Microbacterium limosum TaxID=3079935 RepID=A0AAU0MEG7_9MICO|nr:septum formation initiator family protein [Microbacterium sp. Y20]WOQ68943.1 septum formation initiator family protein [Microbacterium sp. Y20]
MAKRPAPPSGLFGGPVPGAAPRTPDAAGPAGAPRAARRRGARRDEGRAPRRQVDVRGWLGGIRLSGFMVVMMGLVVLAAFVLVPTVGTFVQQRQNIAALEASVTAAEADVAELEAQQERWGDPAYITTQARERLYYTRPGEVVYLVLNDLDASLLPAEETPVSAEVTETRTDWMTQLLGSVTQAGLSATVRQTHSAPREGGTPAG